ncbi:dTDP-4-dehydrorhamnose 3,5-epimerase [Elizabethkingia meningoseptica]|uniref:dTDP-4-dehydrorhamnose 3,5-epimerase n=1 Tax=Elizabethkingia meningoseptica TaxID=238 RepID=UPI000332D6C4|nr:dTDP-4-dehydrorhamnose 3,5-epimerase [Elizabethkingia meningoseptica]AQX04993.1 dTDP-4-dehydrorhamnose 3,5-epimerase [Elizabethkingia meningoseptica]AQX47034.1 dTDP-4-dehydrorhamnose 3,5-epimerase [Elizabethkingia meningoseptica]EOR29158.1 dTDP-4-dehydrorhamnose 3,5-epimerase-related enzyme [Elizabethkingia meningoseptica ATCC 13253 = NBRC 12535]KUY17991.1 dTDP-4-dehydrorhamnose 3,5-epimerase [Elizabethkingia meningoseptica]MDE5489089.1 dTDP-4-dehydrorhamnose 3,5-epimerase [Elizabethkingia 
MKLIETPLKDCYIIEPTIFEDERGYFYEKYNENKFEELTGLNGHFVQDNISKSSFGVLRGLHLQKGDYAQAKLVSCLEGKVWDIAVDLRKDSPSFGQWYGMELSAENKLQFYVPRGFAHGFVVLSETAIFSYKCDNFYKKEAEGCVKYNDPDLNIDWKISEAEMILSEKDQNAPSFKDKNY